MARSQCLSYLVSSGVRDCWKGPGCHDTPSGRDGTGHDTELWGQGSGGSEGVFPALPGWQVGWSGAEGTGPPGHLPRPRSAANVKKWEVELQTLRESNARLTAALQESAASVEQWKRQFSLCREENDRLRNKVGAGTAAVVGGCFVKFRTGRGRGGGGPHGGWCSLGCRSPVGPLPAQPGWTRRAAPLSPHLPLVRMARSPASCCLFHFGAVSAASQGARPSADSPFPPEAWPSGLPEGSVALCCSFQAGSWFLFASESQTQTREESAPLNENHWEPPGCKVEVSGVPSSSCGWGFRPRELVCWPPLKVSSW